MKTVYQYAALILSTTLAYGVSAETLYGPVQGNSLQFADHSVSIYYTEKGKDFEVVTTIGADSDHDYLYRFITELANNEQHSIVIGGVGKNKTHATLTISRVGNKVSADIIRQDVIVEDNPELTSRQ